MTWLMGTGMSLAYEGWVAGLWDGISRVGDDDVGGSRGGIDKREWKGVGSGLLIVHLLACCFLRTVKNCIILVLIKRLTRPTPNASEVERQDRPGHRRRGISRQSNFRAKTTPERLQRRTRRFDPQP